MLSTLLTVLQLTVFWVGLCVVCGGYTSLAVGLRLGKLGRTPDPDTIEHAIAAACVLHPISRWAWVLNECVCFRCRAARFAGRVPWLTLAGPLLLATGYLDILHAECELATRPWGHPDPRRRSYDLIPRWHPGVIVLADGTELSPEALAERNA